MEITPKEFYSMRKRAGVCVCCGTEDAFTMAGRSYCSRCAERIRQNKQRQYAVDEKKIRMYSQHQNGQQKRRDAGLCPTCGRPATPGYSTCPYCRAKRRNYMRNYRNSFHRGEDGICWTCNKNRALPGMRLCQDCYDATMQNQQKAVEELRKKKENGFVHPWKRGNDLAFSARAQDG